MDGFFAVIDLKLNILSNHKTHSLSNGALLGT